MRPTAAVLRDHLTGRNIIAGIVVGAYLVPQAMAYGELAGVGPSVGLSVALIPLILYPLIGRSRWLSLGPESAVALMAAATVGPIAARYDQSPAALLGLVSVLTGLVLLTARLAKVGFVTDLLSKPVLIGYLTGVGVVMAMSQLGRLAGSDIDADSVPALVADLRDGVSVNGYALAIGLGTLGVILAFNRWLPRFPGTLVALALGVVAGSTLPVETIGAISLQAPQFAVPTIPWDAFGELLLASGAIAIVAFTDVIVTARAFADNERVDPHRELTALGATDVVGGFFGAYPISASSSRTAIARMNGATSRFYSWVVAFVVVAAALTLAGVLSNLPEASLAGIILFAAWTLVDRAGWQALRRMRWGEVLVGAGCAVGVVVLGILPGLAIAIALSITELLVRLSRPHEGILGFVPGMAGMHDVDDYPDAEQVPGLVVYRYDSPLFFANANDFYGQCLEAADTPGCRWLVLNVEANVEVDSTGLDALIELHDALRQRGILLALARVKNDLMAPMQRYGVLDVIGAQNVYATLPTAVEAYRTWAAGQPAGPPAAGPSEPLKPHRFARSDHPRRPQPKPPS